MKERDISVEKLARHKIGDEITQAALDSGVKKSLLKHLKRDAFDEFEVRDDKVGAWDEDDIMRTDSKGGPLTPETYVIDYLSNNPDFVEPNRGSGAQGAGDQGRGGATPRFISPEQAGDHLEDIASGAAVIQE